jgi:hypothetical protein
MAYLATFGGPRSERSSERCFVDSQMTLHWLFSRWWLMGRSRQYPKVKRYPCGFGVANMFDARTFFRDQAATVQWSGRFRPKAATLLFERL